MFWTVLILSSAVMMADEEVRRPKGVKRAVRTVLNFIDTMAVRGIDTAYIEVPEKPWAFVLRSNLSQSFVRMQADDVENSSTTRIRSNTDLTTSIGGWIGYRGYGLGYSVDLTGDRGSNFTTGFSNLLNIFTNLNIGAMGGRYGVNLRIRTFKVGHSRLSVWGSGKDDLVEDASMEIGEPMKVRSVFADAYYMFNGKRFSYSAAYDQSAIQIHSSGSLVAGLMYHYSRVEYDSEENLFLLDMMDGIGQIKMWQASLGVGYAYNWVPKRRWLVSAMFLPMITFYNRAKVSYYERDHPDAVDQDTGVHFVGSEMTKNKVVPNFDARLSITYNRARYYLNAYATYNSFRFNSNEGGSIRLGDWYAYFSWGLRF